MNDPDRPLLVVAAVILRDGLVLLARRAPGSHLAGCWEFPGGKVEPGEEPPRALEREIAEELGVEGRAGPPFTFNYHVYPDRRVLLLAYRVEILGEPRPPGVQEIGWFAADQIAALATPPADGPIFDRLLPLLARDGRIRSGGE